MDLDPPVRSVGALPGTRQALWVDLRALAILILLAAGVGVLSNPFRRAPLPLRYISAPARLQNALASLPAGGEVTPQVELIGLEALRRFVDTQAALIIDARPDVFYRAGHVPGALNLARETFAADYARLRPRLDQARDALVVLYCADPDCPDGALVAGALQQLGFRRVVDYPEGWEGWTAAGLPSEQSPKP